MTAVAAFLNNAGNNYQQTDSLSIIRCRRRACHAFKVVVDIVVTGHLSRAILTWIAG